ncbi:MAG: ribosome recycling factor [Saprospiraceae bacterium]|nr:ribosome recycling factor [Saprospiraceae bacterium]
MEEIIELAKMGMDSAIEHLQQELVKVRTGKASASMLGGIVVSYYGSPTPLNQVSNISASDSRTLNIQPWEKNMLGPIEKAIFEANLGITPQNNGEMVILNIPPLTEERRRELVKKSKSLAEDSKVGVRQARREAIDEIKKEVKNGYPEDAGKKKEDEIQDLTNKYTHKIDEMVKAKEADIMKI